MPPVAMVLAAGEGLRMRPITDTLPKPLIEIAGRTLIDRVIDRLEDAAVERVVVNVHHLAARIESHLRGRRRPAIAFSREDVLLDTGGGVAKALPRLGTEPFWVVNADVMWLDGPRPALQRLAEAWDDETMDGLLLLHPTVFAFGYAERGDFLVDPLGRLARRPEQEVSPYLFAGVQVLHRRLFADPPSERFSLNVLYDRAIERSRLFGAVHDGEWFHVGTPVGLAAAETYMRTRFAGRERR